MRLATEIARRVFFRFAFWLLEVFISETLFGSLTLTEILMKYVQWRQYNVSMTCQDMKFTVEEYSLGVVRFPVEEVSGDGGRA